MSKKRVLICDTLNIYMYHFHAHTPEKLWRFLTDLHAIVDKFNVSRVVFATEGGNAYRTKIHPGYKADRIKRRAEQPEDEQARFKNFLKEDVNDLLDTLKLLGIPVLKHVGAEADDVIAYYANNIDLERYDLMILSSDTDLHQLLRPGIVQASYGRDMAPALAMGAPIPARVWLNTTTFTEQYEVTPRQYTLVKSLAGDTSDSIPSPGGLGEGTALKLIMKYGTIDAIEAATATLEYTIWAQQFGGIDKVISLLETPEVDDEEHENLLGQCVFDAKTFKKIIKAELATFHVPRMSQNVKEALARGEMSIVRRNIGIVDLNDPAIHAAILGDEGIAYLNESLERLALPAAPDKKAFKELLFECGRISMAERMEFWLHPFTRE